MHKSSQKGFQLCNFASLQSSPLTFGAREEGEESAGVAPAEPVPSLDEALVL